MSAIRFDRLMKFGLILAAALIMFQFAGFAKAYGAEPEFVYARGEISDGKYIYSDEWIGLIFRNELRNDDGQATDAIQKAANKTFGWHNTKVETYDNKSFIITMRAKIELSDAKEIVLPEGSLKDAKSGAELSKDIILPVQSGNYTPIVKPASRGKSGSSPHEPTPTAPPPGPPPTPALPTTTQKQQYAVVRGDALWVIAERFYGDGNQWVRIYEANKDNIKNPHLIFPGQVLNIPDKAQ